MTGSEALVLLFMIVAIAASFGVTVVYLLGIGYWAQQAINLDDLTVDEWDTDEFQWRGL